MSTVSDRRSRTGRWRRVACAALVLAQAAPASAAGPDDAVPPSQWPSSSGGTLSLVGWPNALRFGGDDRYLTSFATTLALRGRGDFPFDTPDPSSAGAATLAAADDWWGAGRCPRAIIIVSGGSSADALAASALSDPTGNSTEPYLQRTAAADPLFDPIGGYARVDTDDAPIIVTQRTGAGLTTLSTSARQAAEDLRSGGCTLARQAVIVGGQAAVPGGVEADLLSLGYDEVFRVAGPTRYDTASRVAQSLGTAALPVGVSQCVDPVTDDGDARMSFVVNAAIEYRTSATSCELLSRTVVLADGITGADALAAGWWTSFWQVPVLLHDGSATLPAATASALSVMNVDHVIVLGGTARISEAVATQAGTLASAAVTRIAGDDRWATSVEMARRLGGWWPTGRADEFEGSMVCLAASAGSGVDSTGWPDALGAGPLCAALGGAAGNPGTPSRALSPVTGQSPQLSVDLSRPGHDAVPILLVPTGTGALPASVADLLEAAFEPADSWCTSVSAPTGCASPGFAIGFGGSSVLPDSVLAQASSLVSGGSTSASAPESPALTGPFVTALDLSPVFSSDGFGPRAVCVARNGASGARWLAVYHGATATAAIADADLMMDGSYLADADGVVRTRGIQAPVCLRFDHGAAVSATARTVSLAGRAGSTQTFDVSAGASFDMSDAIAAATPTAASGVASDLDASLGGTTTRTYLFSSPAPSVGVVSRGAASAVTANSSVTIVLARGANVSGQTGPDTFTATWSIVTALGTVTGTAAGEAILDAGTWYLRGRSVFTGGSWNVGSGAGGFAADLDTNAPGSADDDAITLQVDGVVTG